MDAAMRWLALGMMNASATRNTLPVILARMSAMSQKSRRRFSSVTANLHVSQSDADSQRGRRSGGPERLLQRHGDGLGDVELHRALGVPLVVERREPRTAGDAHAAREHGEP